MLVDIHKQNLHLYYLLLNYNGDGKVCDDDYLQQSENQMISDDIPYDWT
jgi:hypothetical protein